MAKIAVGMSGGVDSSLSAAILKEEGHDVIGLFMRNWRETDESGRCNADEDFQDVKDVCNALEIPYYSVDFSKEYYDKVFEYFLSEYAKGRTPNPDVLCNKEIKFDVFLDYALKTGADYVATGHYCRVKREKGENYLLRAYDENKDQTYFLNQITSDKLEKVLFPIGEMDKPTVRRLAEKYGLSTAEKKDSTGICFIGERNFRHFLSEYLPMKKGDILDASGVKVGEHEGVYYYTLGQRRGLGIGGRRGENDGRWFVIGKDVQKNILYVSHTDQSVLYNDALETDGFNWINKAPSENNFKCLVRIRHRQPMQEAVCTFKADGGVKIVFDTPQRAIAEGQYAVVYSGEYCLGGGVIERKYDSK